MLTLILDCSERSRDLVHVTVTVDPSSTHPGGTVHDITVPLYEEHYEIMWQRSGVNEISILNLAHLILAEALVHQPTHMNFEC